MDSLQNRFLSPGPETRGKPFWSWNGKLDREEVLRQVHVMKAMGMGGFFIHSRTGLQTEYLGEEWMELCRLAAEEGARLDMQVFLYDEDRWPSGSAGGYATMNPRHRMKFIAMDRPGGKFDLKDYGQEFLAAFAVRLEGEDLIDYYPVSHRLELKSGYEPVVFRVQEMQKGSVYNGYTYLDTLSREATECFLSLTHERYKAAMGELFGKEILGVFTDEPYRGALFSGFGLANEEKLTMAPYTYTLFGDFKKMWGEDLLAKLPELYFRPKGQLFGRTAWQYAETVQTLFLENFAKPCQEWCRANKLAVTGHILHEDSLSIQASLCGSAMRYYEYMDYPGVDILTEGHRGYWVVKQLTSVCKQLKKPLALSELYGATGWQMNFENYKAVGDWQALLGVNLRCQHLSWYTMAGEAKRDYPASFLHQSGWYRDHNYLESYFARFNTLMSEGEPVTEVLVLNPVESAWAAARLNWMDGLTPRDKAVAELDRAYEELCDRLLALQIDFDYGDEGLMKKYAVAGSDEQGAFLKVGAMTYRKVVMGKTVTLRASTRALLQDFCQRGGKLILTDELPAFVDMEPAEWGEDFPHAVRAHTPAELKKALRPALVEAEITAGSGPVFAQVRKAGEDFFVALLNMDREKGCTARIRLPRLNAEQWDARSGEVLGIPFDRGRKETVLTHTFPAGGELLLRLTEGETEPFLPAGTLRRAELPERFDYELSEPNVLVLDMADCCVNNTFVCTDEILKIDRAVRSRFRLPLRGGEMLQPWFRRKFFGESRSQKVCRLRLVFSFEVETLPEHAALALENAAAFSATLNDLPLYLTPSGEFFIDKCFDVVPLRQGDLRLGTNLLTLECDFREDLDLEAVYLLGDFGVRLEGLKKTVTALPDKLRPGDLCEQGLPFYTGHVMLHTGLSNCLASVRFSGMGAALYKVYDGKTPVETVAFPPYESRLQKFSGELCLELVLNRRNLFGPLHLKPKRAGAYGPDHFLTEGDSFDAEGYQLIPCGLPALPEVLIK